MFLGRLQDCIKINFIRGLHSGQNCCNNVNLMAQIFCFFFYALDRIIWNKFLVYSCNGEYLLFIESTATFWFLSSWFHWFTPKTTRRLSLSFDRICFSSSVLYFFPSCFSVVVFRSLVGEPLIGTQTWSAKSSIWVLPQKSRNNYEKMLKTYVCYFLKERQHWFRKLWFRFFARCLWVAELLFFVWLLLFGILLARAYLVVLFLVRITCAHCCSFVGWSDENKYFWRQKYFIISVHTRRQRMYNFNQRFGSRVNIIQSNTITSAVRNYRNKYFCPHVLY